MLTCVLLLQEGLGVYMVTALRATRRRNIVADSGDEAVADETGASLWQGAFAAVAVWAMVALILRQAFS